MCLGCLLYPMVSSHHTACMRKRYAANSFDELNFAESLVSVGYPEKLSLAVLDNMTGVSPAAARFRSAIAGRHSAAYSFCAQNSFRPVGSHLLPGLHDKTLNIGRLVLFKFLQTSSLQMLTEESVLVRIR